MKEFNKEEYNKMCAEFLGWSQREFGFWNGEDKLIHRESLVLTSDLKFDSDWNWIMEVYHKIINKDTVILTPKNGIESITPYLNQCSKIRRSLMYGEKAIVVKAIWEFLNWVKENKK